MSIRFINELVDIKVATLVNGEKKIQVLLLLFLKFIIDIDKKETISISHPFLFLKITTIVTHFML